MEFEPIQSPVYSKPPPSAPKALTEVPKPITVYSAIPSEVEKQPPPYTKHSPFIFGSGRSVQSMTMSVKGNTDHSVKTTPKANQQHSGERSYQPSIPNAVDSHRQPLVPPDQDDKSAYSRCSKRSQGSKHADHEDVYDDGDLGDWEGKLIKSFTFKPKDLPSVIVKRSLKAKGAKCRAKYDSLKWDGFNTTFRTLKRAIEGHLFQVGAGYMTNPSFIIEYEESGNEYLQSNEFWTKYRISHAQALYDKEYLFGIFVTATMKLQHKTIF